MLFFGKEAQYGAELHEAGDGLEGQEVGAGLLVVLELSSGYMR